MRSDISKLGFAETNHYLGVFQQMGRQALESDANEQNELLVRLVQRLAGDAVHTGSPNDGFRVDTRLLLDACDRRASWSATPAGAQVFVDYFDHRVGDGSLVAAGATAITRKLEAPLDLSTAVEVLAHAKGTFAALNFRFVVSDGATTHAFTMTELAPQDGWRVFRAAPGAWPAGFAADQIVEYGFDTLDATVRYGIDALRADLPVFGRFVDTALTERFSFAPATATLAVDDDARFQGSLAIKISGATALDYDLPATCDLSRARALRVPLRRSAPTAAFNVTLVDAATPPHSVTLAGATATTAQGWEVLRFALPQAGTFDWERVSRLRLENLATAESYWLGAVAFEVDPASDLIVAGGDGTSDGAGRFYGDGLAAIKESNESYGTQPDLPLADPAALEPVAEGTHRVDWAYLDLWTRPLSYIERPGLRDVVLEGQDTCTRTQLIGQVRLLKGEPVALAAAPVPPTAAFAALPRLGNGTLSTKDKPAATLDPCADPCEPRIAGPYLGEGDRLFRVEIHRGGNVGAANDAATAIAKWSRDNGAVASALIADAALGTTSAVVERPDLFAIGDLIEISDDLVELITGPYEDRVDHRNHRRGELRRVVTVNHETRRVSWDDPGSAVPVLHAPLPQPMRVGYHAKLTKWDGLVAAIAGDIVLTDGVTIELGGDGFQAGEYWLFTTRVADRSVERLIEAPPRGTRHAYYRLATIHRSRGAGQPEAVTVDDVRARFAPLPELDASRVSFDPGAGAVAIPGWDEIGTVQEAIDAIARADLNADLRLHHRLMHGYGIVCGLKLRCSPGRERVVLGKGYALDREGYTIHVPGDKAIDVVAQADAQGLLDASGTGVVDLRIERSATADADIEIHPHASQGFWASVLEGTLLKDFYDKVILAYVNFFKAQLTPFPSPVVPLSVQHRRAIAVLNLLWQLINPSTGPYVYISPREHELLRKLYFDIQDLLASKTFCGMFDRLSPFPAYPYSIANPGIDTLFGTPLFHHRVKLTPDGAFAYTFGVGNQIQVFDLTARELAEVLTFPGGTNLTVMDAVFHPNGQELYVVGLMDNSTDSIFATFNTVTRAWGPTTVVCDIKFMRLALHPLDSSRLFATGRSAGNPTLRGLYSLTPNAILLSPTPALAFNATGLLEVNADGLRIFAAESSGASDTDSFDRVRCIDPNASPNPVTVWINTLGGNELADDLKAHEGILYLTGTVPPSTVRGLHRINVASGAVVGSTPLGTSTINRLAVLPARNLVWISQADLNKVSVYEIATNTVRAAFRVPLQVFPMALAARRGGSEVVGLNFILNSLNLVDVAQMEAVTPPTYTLEVGNTLPAYHTAATKAFTDLLSVFGQSVKDAFCDLFLVECHDPTEKDVIYLGSVDIRARRVYHICNFNKRHYAKSFRTWGYWLSTVPILPMIKRAFATFSCKIL